MSRISRVSVSAVFRVYIVKIFVWCWFLSCCWANNCGARANAAVLLTEAITTYAAGPALLLSLSPNRRMRWGVSFETFSGLSTVYIGPREKPSKFRPIIFSSPNPSRLNWADLSSSSSARRWFSLFLARPLYQQGPSLSLLLSILAFLHHVRLGWLRLCICWPVSAPIVNGNSILHARFVCVSTTQANL